MPKPKNAYEVLLPDGRSVVMAELDVDELELAMQRAGTQKSEDARRFRQSVEGLRLSIRKIGDHVVTYTDLTGKLWSENFSVLETSLLTSVWAKVHLPSDEVVEAAGELRAVTISGG